MKFQHRLDIDTFKACFGEANQDKDTAIAATAAMAAAITAAFVSVA